MTREKITFKLNGLNRTLEVDPKKSLLEVVREDLHLTGTKRGCDGGQCGACSLLVDGELRLSCVLPVGEVAGREVTTIEGLGTPERLHPIQEAFVEAGAIQCGFCAPGMIMATKALLDRHPKPSREDISTALSRNLCRCTGYVKIFDAVMIASEGLTMPSPVSVSRPERGVVGKSLPLVDAPEKATGQAQYGDDLSLPEMLHGKVVRSPYPHAEILGIDTKAALHLPGVHGIFTARDVDGTNRHGRFVKDQPVLCQDRVRFAGDPVALVVAETEREAEEASAQVKVDYRSLPAVFEAGEALKETSPQLNPGGNLCAESRILTGDVEKSFTESDFLLQRTYETPFAEHAYLEPEAGVGYIDGEGRVVVAAGTQSPHFIQGQIAQALGLEKSGVRIVQTKAGGGFGGRHEVSIHCLLALAALNLRRPVKIRYSRRESMATTVKRHPFLMDLKAGIRKDGTLSGLHANYIANTGAYTGNGPGVFTRAMLHATGPYHFPHLKVSVKGVFTNNPSSGGMRGFGVPQVTLAIECHLDQLAHGIGMDPWDLRYKNAYTSNHVLPTGQKIPGRVEIRRCLEVIKPYYDRMKAETAARNRNSEKIRYGVGLGTAMFGIGITGLRFPGRAWASLREDGVLMVRAGVTDLGQGVVTTLTQIASDEFGVPIQRVRVFHADTLTEPDSGPMSASRQIFFTGRALCGSLKKLKGLMLDVSRQIFEKGIQKITLDDDFIFPDEDQELALPVSEFVRKAREKGVTLEAEDIYDPGITDFDPKTGRGHPYPAYTYAAQVAEVSVHETGKIDVLRVVAAQDVGRAINPMIVEGQLEGSILMGIGWVLKEKFVPGKTESLATYSIPRSRDVPEITTIFVETDEPGAPFGAKGIGEGAMVPTAPAILNGIASATGVRFYEIPVDQSRLTGDSWIR
jgi:CO/xanthine dehydrogenase Mo-binding subunit/aerobic-type carbon monoxide dehydrogenase small subunit (CoxS/CutS family)